MAEQQPTTSGLNTSGNVITVDVPGELIDLPGSGIITVQLPVNTPPDQMRELALRMAKEQGASNRLGIESPTGHSVGFQMPAGATGDAFAEAMRSALAAAPQFASFVSQFFPGVRAFGTAGSMAIPAAARVGSNLFEGKSPGEDVMTDALLGLLFHAPQGLGSTAKDAATPIMKHNLFATTAGNAITPRMEETLPELALKLRGAPTKAGVAKMGKHAADAASEAQTKALMTAPHMGVGPSASAINASREATQYADDVAMIEQMLEGVRKQHSLRGSGSAMTSVLPGSGAVTTGTRALGLPAAVGQIASPAVAMIKGSPARRMAFARNLHRPGNIADADTLGLILSQLLRAGYAANTFMEPVASHERGNVGAGPSSLPRRRQ